MISSVSSQTPIQQTTAATTPAPPPVSKPAPKEDSVQLSSAALQAAGSGDADHDGDSH